MNRADEEALAKRRLFTMTFAGLGGVALMLLGIAVWRTDFVREGGWPLAGGLIFAAGLLDAILVPKLLAARWRSPKDL